MFTKGKQASIFWIFETVRKTENNVYIFVRRYGEMNQFIKSYYFPIF